MDHIGAWQCISPERIVKCFMKCCISIALVGTDGGMLWNDSEKDEDVRKMKVLTVKVETVILIGKGT